MNVELIEALGGGAVAMYITKELVSFAKHRRRKRKEERQTFDKVLPAVSAIYEAMAEIQRETGAARVAVLSAHNGGGRPAIGSLMRSSVVYEVAPRKEPMRESWQGQMLDHEYMKVLVGIDTAGVFAASVADLQDSLQRKTLVSQGVVSTVMQKIAVDDKNFYYLVVDFDTKAAYDEAPIAESIRAGANRIQNLWR